VKNHRDIPPTSLEVTDVTTADYHAAGINAFNAGDAAQNRHFAGPPPAQNSGYCARWRTQRNLFQDQLVVMKPDELPDL
jgi:hypothetical protein